jgi:glutathione S-transferase
VVEDYSRWFLARLRAVETALIHSGSEHLCAGRFTAADVAVGYALLLAQHLGLAPQFGPATQAYWQRLQQRPGYQRAMEVQVRAAKEQGVPTTPAPDTQP